MASSATTTDHDAIKQWTKEHNGVPAVIEETAKGNDSRMLRIHFPEASNDEQAFREISWGTFFDTFEQRELAFLHSTEKGSTFYKFVAR